MCQIGCYAGIGAASGAIAGTMVAGPAGFIGAVAGASIGAVGGLVTGLISELVGPLFDGFITLPIAFFSQIGVAVWMTALMDNPLVLSDAFLLSGVIYGIAIGMGLSVGALCILSGCMLATRLRGTFQ